MRFMGPQPAALEIRRVRVRDGFCVLDVLIRNNRIIGVDFLNRIAFDAHFESILLRYLLKIFFRQHRPTTDVYRAVQNHCSRPDATFNYTPRSG